MLASHVVMCCHSSSCDPQKKLIYRKPRCELYLRSPPCNIKPSPPPTFPNHPPPLPSATLIANHPHVPTSLSPHPQQGGFLHKPPLPPPFSFLFLSPIPAIQLLPRSHQGPRAAWGGGAHKLPHSHKLFFLRIKCVDSIAQVSSRPFCAAWGEKDKLRACTGEEGRIWESAGGRKWEGDVKE